MTKTATGILRDQIGSTAIEYALIVSLIAIALVAVRGVGPSATKVGLAGKMTTVFSEVRGALK